VELDGLVADGIQGREGRRRLGASSASSRPVTNTMRRSNSFSCNQAESRRRLEGS